jgi:hypothetical protein
VGVDVTLEGSRESDREELRLGEGELPYVTLRAGELRKCPSGEGTDARAVESEPSV